MKRFLDLADFSREQILDLLALAQSLQVRPQPQALAGKILGLISSNPSLRTLASFRPAWRGWAATPSSLRRGRAPGSSRLGPTPS